MGLQPFKATDPKEAKIRAALLPLLESLGQSLDEFYEGAFTAFPLGDVLYQSGRDPTIGPTTQAVFRTAFFSIHELFTRPGPFEYYIQVFKTLWGDTVELEFTIPGNGKLHIDVTASEINLEQWQNRVIVDGAYVRDITVDHLGDPIVFKTKKGIRTQEELDALLREIVPAGIYVTSTLTVE